MSDTIRIVFVRRWHPREHVCPRQVFDRVRSRVDDHKMVVDALYPSFVSYWVTARDSSGRIILVIGCGANMYKVRTHVRKTIVNYLLHTPVAVALIRERCEKDERARQMRTLRKLR